MLTEREEKAVAFLRREASCYRENVSYGSVLARALELAASDIEAGEHLKRPDPSISFEQWRDEPSAGDRGFGCPECGALHTNWGQCDCGWSGQDPRPGVGEG